MMMMVMMIAIRVAIGWTAVPRIGPSVASITSVVTSSSTTTTTVKWAVVAWRRAVIAASTTETTVGRRSGSTVWSRCRPAAGIAIIDIVIAATTSAVFDWLLSSCIVGRQFPCRTASRTLIILLIGDHHVDFRGRFFFFFYLARCHRVTAIVYVRRWWWIVVVVVHCCCRHDDRWILAQGELCWFLVVFNANRFFLLVRVQHYDVNVLSSYQISRQLFWMLLLLLLLSLIVFLLRTWGIACPQREIRDKVLKTFTNDATSQFHQ